MSNNEIAEPDISELIILRMRAVGADLNVQGRRVWTSSVVPSVGEPMTVKVRLVVHERASRVGSAERCSCSGHDVLKVITCGS